MFIYTCTLSINFIVFIYTCTSSINFIVFIYTCTSSINFIVFIYTCTSSINFIVLMVVVLLCSQPDNDLSTLNKLQHDRINPSFAVACLVGIVVCISKRPKFCSAAAILTRCLKIVCLIRDEGNIQTDSIPLNAFLPLYLPFPISSTILYCHFLCLSTPVN